MFVKAAADGASISISGVDLDLCTPQKLPSPPVSFSRKYAFRLRRDPSCAAVKPQPLLGACLEVHVPWGSFVNELKKGSAIEMFSMHGMWAPATVTDMRYDGNLLRQVKIQSSGSFAGDCEWICVEDCRLAPPHTHVRPMGSGKLGPRLRVSSAELDLEDAPATATATATAVSATPARKSSQGKAKKGQRAGPKSSAPPLQ